MCAEPTIASAFATLDGCVEALYFTSNPLFRNNKLTIGTPALKARLSEMNFSSKKRPQEVCCHMDQAFLICFGAPLSWSTR